MLNWIAPFSEMVSSIVTTLPLRTNISGGSRSEIRLKIVCRARAVGGEFRLSAKTSSRRGHSGCFGLLWRFGLFGTSGLSSGSGSKSLASSLRIKPLGRGPRSKGARDSCTLRRSLCRELL